MATLEWDEVGERKYQTGIDHGVLYLNDGTVVPWNGLRGMEESYNQEGQSYYIDGVKYLQRMTPEISQENCRRSPIPMSSRTFSDTRRSVTA